jgi:hypothetical protein
MCPDAADSDDHRMKKRVLATGLWFYAAWFAGAMLAFATGLTPALGPIFGTAAGAFVGLDPMHVIWPRSATMNVAPRVATAQVQNPA